MADELISVEGLRIEFSSPRGTVRAVDGVDLAVRKGEFVGLVGESGSGKSMTALALAGLVPEPGRVTSGSVRLGGKDILKLDSGALRAVRMSEIGIIFQDAGSYLNPVMRIEDQLLEAIGRRGSRKPKDRAQVLEALKAVQIPEPERIAGAYPFQLSGGMQQRVMIASVLIRRPSLIIADEPTTALDATVQHQVLKFLAHLRQEYDTTLILISHDLAVIANVCDRIYVMYAGQIVEEGTTATIFDEPKHPYTRALVDAILDPFDPKNELKALEGSPPDMAAPPSGCRFHPRCSRRFGVCSAQAPSVIRPKPHVAVRCWLYATEECCK